MDTESAARRYKRITAPQPNQAIADQNERNKRRRSAVLLATLGLVVFLLFLVLWLGVGRGRGIRSAVPVSASQVGASPLPPCKYTECYPFANEVLAEARCTSAGGSGQCQVMKRDRTDGLRRLAEVSPLPPPSPPPPSPPLTRALHSLTPDEEFSHALRINENTDRTIHFLAAAGINEEDAVVYVPISETSCVNVLSIGADDKHGGLLSPGVKELLTVTVNMVAGEYQACITHSTGRRRLDLGSYTAADFQLHPDATLVVESEEEFFACMCAPSPQPSPPSSSPSSPTPLLPPPSPPPPTPSPPPPPLNPTSVATDATS